MTTLRAGFALVLSLTAGLHAQCTLSPQALAVPPGIDGVVYAVTEWDPDGPGPQIPWIVCGGNFDFAGGTPVQNIAGYDPNTSQWNAIGAPSGTVRAIVVDGNDLIIGGSLVLEGNVARWDGTSWQSLANGVFGRVHALALTPTGDLIAGGLLTGSGPVQANGVMRWDGTAWSALGLGPSAADALAVNASGTVFMGSSAGVHEFQGGAWTPVGGNVSGQVWALTTTSNGDLLVGGFFLDAGGVPVRSVASWDGQSWSAVGTGVSVGANGLGVVYTIREEPNGDLLVGGWFDNIAGLETGPVARWDGQTWTVPGGSVFPRPNAGPVATVHAVAQTLYGPVLGGEFAVANGNGVDNVAWVTGGGWGPIQPGIRDQVTTMRALADGSLLVGGEFTDVLGVPANGIARWDGQQWSSLGQGLENADGKMPLVRSIQVADNGDAFVAGTFVQAGGAAAVGIARWDGTAWNALGGGLSNPGFLNTTPVYDTLLLDNEDLIVTGFFAYAGGVTVNGMARWDGSAWSAFASPPLGGARRLGQLANGDVVIGGTFSVAGGYDGVLRWDGTGWVQLGAGLTSSVTGYPAANALLRTSTGDLVVAGNFDGAGGLVANNVARWDGSSWQALGTGVPGNVAALVELPNGDLIACGREPWPVGTPTGMWRWDGAGWTQLADGAIGAAAFSSTGQVYAAGRWNDVGQPTRIAFGSMATNCPADATASGSGCTGSGGLNELFATSGPWIGSTFAPIATGMPTNGLVVGVRGLATVTQPLNAILPAGQPGCDLLVSPDLLDLHVPVAGVVSPSFAIPNSGALIGQQLHQQVVPVELDASGNIIALTSSNRLTLTIGSF